MRDVRTPLLRGLHRTYHLLPAPARRPVWAMVRAVRPRLVAEVHDLNAPSRHAEERPLGPPALHSSVSGSAGAVPTDVMVMMGRSLARIERILEPEHPERPLLAVPRRDAAAAPSTQAAERVGAGDVVWDVRGAQHPADMERGISRYIHEQADSYARLFSGGVRNFVTEAQLPLPGRSWRLVSTGRVETLDDHIQKRCDFGEGVWYSTSPFDFRYSLSDVLPAAFRRSGHRWAATCYDLIPLLFADHYLRDPTMRADYQGRLALLRQADLVLCISQSCAADVRRELELPADRVAVIGAGVSEIFRPSTDREAVYRSLKDAFPYIPPDFIMLPSGIDHRKNLDRAIAAYAMLDPVLRKRHHLVLVCKATKGEEHHLRDLARKAGCGTTFHVTGFVSDAEMVALYQAAQLVWFPSLYEGFGLPVVEALACRTPAICSDSSSLVELMPDPSLRFDPTEVRSMADVLQRTLLHPPHLTDGDFASMVAPHTWAAVAERTHEAFAELRRRDDGRPPARRRVAFCTPWPPSKSGVAGYSYRLVESLRDYADVTVFAPVPAAGSRALSEFTSEELIHGRFDAVVVAMGNSDQHIELLDFLRDHPNRCVVQLHDLRLTGLYEAWHSKHRVERRSSETALLSRYYAPGYVEEVDKRYPMHARVTAEIGHWMFREVVGLARRVVVLSAFGAELIRSECPDADVVHVAFSVPSLGAGQADTASRPTPVCDPGLIVSMGVVSDSKNIAVLVEALEVVRRRGHSVRLALVGPGRIEETSVPAAVVRRLVSAGALQLVGPVSDEDYVLWLRRASLAVQLRAYSNGEVSASIADALAVGTPTITTANGPNEAWPTDALGWVPPGVNAEELASTMEVWLSDESRRLVARAAAAAHAREFTFRRGAEDLAAACFPRR